MYTVALRERDFEIWLSFSPWEKGSGDVERCSSRRVGDNLTKVGCPLRISARCRLAHLFDLLATDIYDLGEHHVDLNCLEV